jgi:CheY-like chemotaxis protein
MVKPVFEQTRKPVVLMADDSADQADLVREIFAQCNDRVELHHVDSGDHCLAFLRHEAPYGKAPRPDLLLLDIHMPRVDGYEVMEQLRADPALHSLPVVVFSTSSDAADVRRMYALGCSSYMTKPVEFERLIEAVRGIDAYWFRLVLLPSAR